jgi:hypothetical protein
VVGQVGGQVGGGSRYWTYIHFKQRVIHSNLRDVWGCRGYSCYLQTTNTFIGRLCKIVEVQGVVFF